MNLFFSQVNKSALLFLSITYLLHINSFVSILMSNYNNFNSIDSKQNQFSPSSIPLLSAPHNSNSNSQHKQQQGSSIPTLGVDVFATPLQAPNTIKLSPIHDVSPSHFKLLQPLATPGGIPLISSTSPQLIPNDTSRIRLEPGFVSSKNNTAANSYIINQQRQPNQTNSINTNYNNYTPPVSSNKLPPSNRNIYTHSRTSSRTRNLGFHSRYPSDMTDNSVQENIEHSNFILNTPDRPIINLPNPIELPYNNTYSKYSPYDPIPTNVRKGHNHSLSLDTVGSNFSVKSIGTDDWFNNNPYRHKRTTSNQSTGSVNSPASLFDDNSGILETAKEYSSLPADELLFKLKEPKNQQPPSSKNPKELKNPQLKKKKQQQLFALICLFKHTRISPRSVCPRNVVYSKYADMCKQFSTEPLCNAAFGKMVKVFLPSIKTRRLGIRGSSVYNYCGIELLDKSYYQSKSSTPENHNINAQNIIEFDNSQKGLTNMYTLTEMNEPNVVDYTPTKSKPLNHILNYPQTDIKLQSTPKGKLIFDNNLLFFLTENIELVPNISKIITSELDNKHKEIISNYFEYLSQLYTTWRYLKIESLLNKVENFNFKTILNEEQYSIYMKDYEVLSPLIVSCNLEFYRNAVKLILKIIFQQVPSNVVDALTIFENDFLKHIKNLDDNSTILKQKIGYASEFIKIISILRRVITLADTASRLLSKQENKNSICEEWKGLNIEKLIENNSIYNDDIKPKIVTFLRDNLSNSLKSLGLEENTKLWEQDTTACQNNIIRILSSTFSSIPKEFNDIEAKDLLLYLDSTASLLLRELTWEEKTSNFTIWWTLTSWCNEYLLLMAEVGKFL